MKKWVWLIFAPLVAGADQSPVTFPVFLKAGFSSVLEFEEPPTKVVLGDSQAFQVERLDNSLVVKTLSPYAVTNMFVYFKTKPTRLFVLTANEDSEPTYFKRFETILPPKPPVAPHTYAPTKRGARLLKVGFDSTKDYLTIEAVLSADSASPVIPNWDLVRLVFKSTSIKPTKLWSARKDIQKDTAVRTRFVFTKPNVPRDLANTVVVIPLLGDNSPLRLVLGSAR